jgi:hypothetical protein
MTKRPVKSTLSDTNISLDGLTDVQIDTIKKVREIQTFLFNDKNKIHHLNDHIIEYCDICLYIDNSNKDFSDNYLIRRVNKLYNTIFKSKRGKV